MSATNTAPPRENTVGLADEEAVNIPICVSNADEAIAIIQRHREARGFWRAH